MGRKTEFELDFGNHVQIATAVIVGQKPDNEPFLYIRLTNSGGARYTANLSGRDLERLAVNVLKALGSKKLAFSQRYNSKAFFTKPKKLKR